MRGTAGDARRARWKVVRDDAKCLQGRAAREGSAKEEGEYSLVDVEELELGPDEAESGREEGGRGGEFGGGLG